MKSTRCMRKHFDLQLLRGVKVNLLLDCDHTSEQAPLGEHADCFKQLLMVVLVR